MRVIVHRYGQDPVTGPYEMEPENAARRFCEEQGIHVIGEEKNDAEIIVKPDDDEARALPGWEDSPTGKFRRYRVTPIIRWEAMPVETFKPPPRL